MIFKIESKLCFLCDNRYLLFLEEKMFLNLLYTVESILSLILIVETKLVG